jgi:hypothetical protein
MGEVGRMRSSLALRTWFGYKGRADVELYLGPLPEGAHIGQKLKKIAKYLTARKIAAPHEITKSKLIRASFSTGLSVTFVNS